MYDFIFVHLYEDFGYEFLNRLDGDFAFVVIDGDDFIAGRDPMGVKPLYYGFDEDGRVYFSSEMKPIADHCTTFDKQLMEAAERFPYNTPTTKEAYYYRAIFDNFYPQPIAAA